VTTADAIIVGSGASAVHATRPLIAAGKSVLMLDVGSRDDRYAPLIPDGTFSHIRRTDANQHRYFLGDRFEGIALGQVRVGAQLTPPRAFINRDVDALTPTESAAFAGMESLGVGGLASGWGAGVGRFTAAELADLPITLPDLESHYADVERNIGISGENDDLTSQLGLHDGMMPALPVDTQCAILREKYLKRRVSFHQAGFKLGITRLAACSREHKGGWGARGPHPLDDMDFWSDKRRAVYRARWTVDELSQSRNFSYLPSRLVTMFRETSGGVSITARRTDTNSEETFDARTLILAAGVFGTARIVLRSLRLYDNPISFCCNPYTYAPCINLGMIGKDAADARHSLSQLTAVFAPPAPTTGPPMHISIYSYRSLLTSKLMKEAPLSGRASLLLMRSLIPAFAVLGLHHADTPTPLKTLTLVQPRATLPERLKIDYALRADESDRIERHERLLLRQFRRLGCPVIKRVRPGHGSSIHYAGTFPMSASPRPLETSRDGLLAGTRAVHIADGSLLRSLPAKGLTLTLMANAHRIGTILASR
jgi:hypothetical protein